MNASPDPAPERLLLAMLDAALLLVERALTEQHPTLEHEMQPLLSAPPTLLLARLLLSRTREMRRLLERYEHALRESIDREDLPF